jgi:hypothetical protein
MPHKHLSQVVHQAVALKAVVGLEETDSRTEAEAH